MLELCIVEFTELKKLCLALLFAFVDSLEEILHFLRNFSRLDFKRVTSSGEEFSWLDNDINLELIFLKIW